MPGTWEHFRHRSDVGVRGCGATPEAAFEQAALALAAVVTDPAHVRPVVPVDIKCESKNADTLLVEFMDAVIHESARKHMVFGRFEVHLDRGRLWARAWGEPIDPRRHRSVRAPKNATRTALRVTRDPEARDWVAQCVLHVGRA